MVIVLALSFLVMIQVGSFITIFSSVISLPEWGATPMRDRKLVSIIICAKNEAANLEKHLPSILAQRYSNDAGKPLYEVIVVNDHSTDNTGQILERFSSQNEHLKIVDLGLKPKSPTGKKQALGAGADIAKGEWLLLTDADCIAASDEWLDMMVAPLAYGKEIVAGYGAYRTDVGMLNKFIRWETLHTFIQYATYVRIRRPYMAVGRNMACTRRALERARNTEVWNALPYGDDDLLVSISGFGDNTAVVYHPLAFTYTDAKKSWASWVRQKQRHLSTGKYYRTEIKISLALYAIAHALMWTIFFICLGWPGVLREILFVIMAVRCIGYWSLWGYMAKRMREKRLIYLFPLFDIGWMLYNFAFSPYIAWKNKESWT